MNEIERLKAIGLSEDDFLPKRTNRERIEELEAQNEELVAQNEMLTECILELASIIYA